MNVGKPMPNDFDFIVELFFKNYLGKSRLLDGGSRSPSFYAVAFIASYETSTFFTDVRAIAQLIGQML
jgi:hypothetical protein